MAKRGENIYKRKDGRWEGRYKNGFKPNGKAKYSSVYGKSYSEVRSILCEKRLKIQENVPVCRLRFGELTMMWLKTIRNNVKESTYANYLMKVKKHIMPYLGNIVYEQLTIKKLDDLVSDRLSSGLSVKYTADIAVLIKSVTKFVHRQFGYADKAEYLSLPRDRKYAEKTLLTDKEQNILAEDLMDNFSPSNAGILLSLSSGIRIGELCALKWSDIDLEKSIITVRKTLQRISVNKHSTKIIVTSPKSRSSVREIPIPDFLVPKLEAIRTDGKNYFLTGSEKFIEPRTMQYRFAAILKKLKLPKVNFHSLRHAFATKCAGLGIDAKTLSEILGHSSVKVTLDRYVHSSIERKRNCMKIFSDNFKAA